jgi:hypothetical protein
LVIVFINPQAGFAGTQDSLNSVGYLHFIVDIGDVIAHSFQAYLGLHKPL